MDAPLPLWKKWWLLWWSCDCLNPLGQKPKNSLVRSPVCLSFLHHAVEPLTKKWPSPIRPPKLWQSYLKGLKGLLMCNYEEISIQPSALKRGVVSYESGLSSGVSLYCQWSNEFVVSVRIQHCSKCHMAAILICCASCRNVRFVLVPLHCPNHLHI